MNKVIKYKGLIVELQVLNHKNALIDLEDMLGEWLMDVDNRFIKHIFIKFYAIPIFTDDEAMESIYEGDYSSLTVVCTIQGWYMSFIEMEASGQEPLILCDDESADLALVASTVYQYYGENQDSILIVPDTFYIERLEILSESCGHKLVTRIIDELPSILDHNISRMPSVLAVFPEPTETIELEQTPKQKALMEQAIKRLYRADALYNGPEKSSEPSNDTNMIEFPVDYIMSEEEARELAKEAEKKPMYPEEHIDRAQFDFYESIGFEEISNTRILLKYLGNLSPDDLVPFM